MEIKFLQNLTNAQLAELNNCSVSTIKRYKKKNNIKHINSKYDEYLELKKCGKYNNVGLSKILDCSIANIFLYDKKSNNRSSYARKYENISFKEYSIFIGTLLGDAWLTKSSLKSYRGGFAHKEQSKDYIKYKQSLLLKHCGKICSKPVRAGNNQYIVRFKANPLLKNLYDKLYINGKKKITKDILKYFTEQSLALYYQDDGSKIKGKNNYFSYKIAMYDYDLESIKTFREFLFIKWNIKTSFNNGCLRILKSSVLKFKYLIKPYIVQSMLYKI